MPQGCLKACFASLYVHADRDHDLIFHRFRTIWCLRMRIGVIHNDMRVGMRRGTNPAWMHPVECSLDSKQIQNGYLRSEGDDVANVTSESLNIHVLSWKSNSPDKNGVDHGHDPCRLHPPPLISHPNGTPIVLLSFQTEACSLSVFSNTAKSVN